MAFALGDRFVLPEGDRGESGAKSRASSSSFGAVGAFARLRAEGKSGGTGMVFKLSGKNRNLPAVRPGEEVRLGLWLWPLWPLWPWPDPSE